MCSDTQTCKPTKKPTSESLRASISGLKLINRDLREDQEYVLDQIVRAAGEASPDAIVVAGDIYDKAIPSVESVELFDCFVLLKNSIKIF